MELIILIVERRKTSRCWKELIKIKIYFFWRLLLNSEYKASSLSASGDAYFKPIAYSSTFSVYHRRRPSQSQSQKEGSSPASLLFSLLLECLANAIRSEKQTRGQIILWWWCDYWPQRINHNFFYIIKRFIKKSKVFL